VLGAILTAVYMTRWVVLIFLAEPRYGSDVHPHESPASMTVPLVALAALSALGGLLNPVHAGPLYRFLGPAVAPIDALALEPAGGIAETGLIGIAIVAAAIGIGLAYVVYIRGDLSRGRMMEPIRGPLAEAMERKFFFDDLYEAVFVRAGRRVADGLVWIDTRVIDGAVNGVGATSSMVGRVSRRAQNGLVRGYVAGLVLGALVLGGVLLIQVV
jgi:NADH-quinone oxidoreductase subunit L